MKKKIALMLAGIMLLGSTISGCGSNAGSLTVKDGTLMVGMEIGYPPMEYLDEDGVTPIGFDVEFSKAIAEEMGMKVEIIDTAWDGILASLDTNRYDIVMSSLSITDKRKENYNMTNAYIANKLCIVTSKDLGITQPSELAGHSVATQTETTADYFMRDRIAEGLDCPNYFVYDKVIQCFDELKLGRVDAVVVDSVVAAYYIGDDADTYKVVWENTEAEPIGIGLKKGNDELTAKLETAIDALYVNGKFKEIATKYFGDSDVAAR